MNKLIVVLLIVLGAASVEAYQRLDSLPHIIELKIVDNEHVQLISDGVALGHVTADGGILDDFHDIEAETGKVKKNETARDPKEISLNVNKGFEIGGFGGYDRFVFLKVENGQVVFHYNAISRNGKSEDTTISISSYKREVNSPRGKEDAQ